MLDINRDVRESALEDIARTQNMSKCISSFRAFQVSEGSMQHGLLLRCGLPSGRLSTGVKPHGNFVLQVSYVELMWPLGGARLPAN